jgi:hypothetical protein
MEGDLVRVQEASSTADTVLVAYVQNCEWNFIISFCVSSLSMLVIVWNVVKASNSTGKCLSLTVLEVDLKFVINHALHHFFGNCELTKRWSDS